MKPGVNAPKGEVPSFAYRRDYGPNVPVPIDDWQPLRESGIGVPLPPSPSFLENPGSSRELLAERPYGLGRLDRKLREWRIHNPVLESNASEPPSDWEWNEVDAARWTSSGVGYAYRHARRIFVATGFTASASGHYIFRDAARTWWALPEYDSGYGRGGVYPTDDEGTYWHLQTEHLALSDLPISLSDDLGGVDGPFDWACEVIGAVQRLRRLSKIQRMHAGMMASLMKLPEWSALANAARREGGDASHALHNLEENALRKWHRRTASGIFERGFAAGEMLGYLDASARLDRFENRRAQKYGPEQDRLIDEWLDEAVASGRAWTAHGLAGQILEASNLDDERRARVKAAHFGGDQTNLGRRIRKRAIARKLIADHLRS